MGKQNFDYVDSRAVTLDEILVYIETFVEAAATQGEYIVVHPMTPAILFKYALDEMLANALKVVRTNRELSRQVERLQAMVTEVWAASADACDFLQQYVFRAGFCGASCAWRK